MKSAGERGRIGAWAYEARQDADLSVEQVQERLARAGHAVTTATLRGVESGSKQPSRRLLRALASVYGKPTPGEDEPPPTDQDGLVAALNRQAAAIEQLVARFDQLASEAIRQGVAGALREAGVDPDDGEPPASPPAERIA